MQETRDSGLILGWKIPWGRKCQPTPVFLPEEIQDCKELGMTDNAKIVNIKR